MSIALDEIKNELSGIAGRIRDVRGYL